MRNFYQLCLIISLCKFTNPTAIKTAESKQSNNLLSTRVCMSKNLNSLCG